MCILLVKNQGCFHPSKIVKAKIIKIFIITPQKNNTLTTIAYCRIARKKNLILRLWKLLTTLCHSTKTKTTQKNYKFWGEHDVNIKEQKTLMLSLYERFSCQFSEIKEWYTYWNGIVSLFKIYDILFKHSSFAEKEICSRDKTRLKINVNEMILSIDNEWISSSLNINVIFLKNKFRFI